MTTTIVVILSLIVLLLIIGIVRSSKRKENNRREFMSIFKFDPITAPKTSRVKNQNIVFQTLKGKAELVGIAKNADEFDKTSHDFSLARELAEKFDFLVKDSYKDYLK